jgi:hypothetical protein
MADRSSWLKSRSGGSWVKDNPEGAPLIMSEDPEQVVHNSHDHK